jgi:hypothetical protein
VLLQELLPALTVQHQLVLNGDALPGDLPALTLQAAAGTHAVLAWRSFGVDDADLRVNRPAESGGT